MRRIRYAVAASLDGYIAGPGGEVDWIVTDPEIDFTGMFKAFDTVLMGRRTFEAVMTMGLGPLRGMDVYVFSRSLSRSDHPGVIIAGSAEETVAALRQRSGKDIWLFGGGSLFHSLAAAGLVDAVEVSIVPVLLGGGVPLLPTPAGRVALRLASHRVYASSGVVSLTYAVEGTAS